MRAGCFAEKRVIDLLNSRFVPFFFNRGGPGKGHDEKARKFTVGKTKNEYAYLAAFTPGGQYLGETHVYADKDAVFAWLCKLLKKHDRYGKITAYEQGVLDAATKKEAEPDYVYSAGELHEKLGHYDDARKMYLRVTGMEKASEQLKKWSWVAVLRSARYQEDWKGHEALCKQAASSKLGLAADLLIENGRRGLGRKEYKTARKLLEQAARGHVPSTRVSEAHFYAGVACWFLEQRDWAKFHWCWVVKRLPKDRLYMRAYIAAAAEDMPYPNYELDNYKGPVGNIGTMHIVNGVRHSMKTYKRLLPEWKKATE